MRRGKRGNLYTREQVLEAIAGSYGNVLTVARRLGCTWATARKYIDRWKETREALAQERMVLLDAAECVIYQAIEQNDAQTAKWVLSRLGKDRGWGNSYDVRQGDVHIILRWEDDAEEQK